MTYARVFQSGNSQAGSRLPKEFRLNAEQVEIFRQGDDIVFARRPPMRLLYSIFWPPCPPTSWRRAAKTSPPQEREAL